MIESFIIMGHTVKVRYGRVPKEAWAWWRPDHKEIVLSPRLKKQPDSHVQHTLIHEVVHAVLDTIGREDLSQDEQFVDLLSNAMHQVVLTAKFVSTAPPPPAE